MCLVKSGACVRQGDKPKGVKLGREKLSSSSLESLLQDCLNIPRLPEYSWLIVSAVDWKADWQCYKHLLPQYHMSWDRPMLLR